MGPEEGLNTEAMNPLDASMDGGDVLLRVKSASHPSCEDLEFRAKSSFSIRQIKERIQNLSSQHPEVKEQRLIYSGHLLEDNQVLKDVLTAKVGFASSSEILQQPVTIHLACSSKYMFSSDQTGSSSKGATPKATNEGPMPAGNQAMFGTQGLPANFGIPQPIHQGNANGAMPQDMMSLHQQYVQQMSAYMNQWYMMQQGMLTGGFFYQMPQPAFVPPGTVPAPQSVPVAPVPQEEAVPPPPQPRPNAAQDRNLAAARALDDDDQRDMLDWMYTLSRVVLILSVVYFYSSFSRFVLVLVFTGLIVIMQRRNGRPHANVNPAPRPPEPIRQEQQNDRGAEGQGPLPGDSDNDNIEADATIQNPPAPPQNVVWTFLTTFFTSLIPENHQNNL